MALYQSQAYGLMNLSTTLTHKPWRVGLVFHEPSGQTRHFGSVRPELFTNGGGLIQDNTYNPPREIGIKIGYTF